MIIKRDNFLKQDDADEIYHTLNTMNEDWWYHANIDDNNEIQLVRRYAQNKHMIDKNRTETLKIFKKHKFSYHYDRTIGDHCDDCKCKLCRFSEEFINSKEFIEWVETVSGYSNLSISHHFFTRYSTGDFLYPHTDDPNGKIAIVINISKDWKPIYGGHLHILDQDGHIQDICEAKFNSLTLMDISKDVSPHFVSFVAPGVDIKRYGIVIWLK